MRQRKYIRTCSIGLLTCFCAVVPLAIAGECEEPNCSRENAASKAAGCSSISPSAATKQTDIGAENKKDPGGAKDKNLSSAPAQINQEIFDSQERLRTGRLIFPTQCISDKEAEEMHRMGQIGTMKERLMQAGFSQERYDKFVEAVSRNGSKKKSPSGRSYTNPSFSIGDGGKQGTERLPDASREK